MTEWRKSSLSTNSSDCVETAVGTTATGLRDSKSPASTLTISRANWSRFLSATKTDEFTAR
jgi:Domain of unknown function (DUF397)